MQRLHKNGKYNEYAKYYTTVNVSLLWGVNLALLLLPMVFTTSPSASQSTQSISLCTSRHTIGLLDE